MRPVPAPAGGAAAPAPAHPRGRQRGGSGTARPGLCPAGRGRDGPGRPPSPRGAGTRVEAERPRGAPVPSRERCRAGGGGRRSVTSCSRRARQVWGLVSKPKQVISAAKAHPERQPTAVGSAVSRLSRFPPRTGQEGPWDAPAQPGSRRPRSPHGPSEGVNPDSHRARARAAAAPAAFLGAGANLAVEDHISCF